MFNLITKIKDMINPPLKQASKKAKRDAVSISLSDEPISPPTQNNPNDANNSMRYFPPKNNE